MTRRLSKTELRRGLRHSPSPRQPQPGLASARCTTQKEEDFLLNPPGMTSEENSESTVSTGKRRK